MGKVTTTLWHWFVPTTSLRAKVEVDKQNVSRSAISYDPNLLSYTIAKPISPHGVCWAEADHFGSGGRSPRQQEGPRRGRCHHCFCSCLFKYREQDLALAGLYGRGTWFRLFDRSPLKGKTEGRSTPDRTGWLLFILGEKRSDSGGEANMSKGDMAYESPEHDFQIFTDYDRDYGRAMQCIRRLKEKIKETSWREVRWNKIWQGIWRKWTGYWSDWTE